MQSLYILLSSVIIFIAYLIYEWSIVTGKTKPHRTTRFVLAVIISMGALSLFAQHSSASVWLMGICAVQSIVVFLMSIKYGMGGWAKSDIVCLAIAVLGIILWKTTNNPVLALYAAVAADFAGMVPCLIKTYKMPETEYWLSYIFDISAGTLTLLAISNWVPGEFVYPMYVVLINVIVLGLILRPKIFAVREA